MLGIAGKVLLDRGSCSSSKNEDILPETPERVYKANSLSCQRGGINSTG